MLLVVACLAALGLAILALAGHLLGLLALAQLAEQLLALFFLSHVALLFLDRLSLGLLLHDDKTVANAVVWPYRFASLL